MDSHLNLDKCNTITTESLENETVKCHPQYRRDFTNGTKLNRKLKQQTREKERKFSRNHCRGTPRRTFRYKNAP